MNQVKKGGIIVLTNKVIGEVNKFIRQAEKLYAAGDIQGALKVIQDAIDKYPREKVLRYHMGKMATGSMDKKKN